MHGNTTTPVTETPPVSLRLPYGSLRNPQTGARDSVRLEACSSRQRVCVPLDAAVPPCNDITTPTDRLFTPGWREWSRGRVNQTCERNVFHPRVCLAFTRYSSSSRPLYTNQYYHLQTAPLFGHTTPTLHCPHYCAIQCFPQTILYCNTCHTTLVIAISCEGQVCVCCLCALLVVCVCGCVCVLT